MKPPHTARGAGKAIGRQLEGNWKAIVSLHHGNFTSVSPCRGCHLIFTRIAFSALPLTLPSSAPQRTLARVNRAISRCGSLREALAVVEEMKAAGIASANEGKTRAHMDVVLNFTVVDALNLTCREMWLGG